MRTLAFAKRNFKEIIRDPISLAFCIGLPLFLLVIFQQFNIPSEVYSIKNFTPSIVIFSYGFISLFAGLLISKDRTTSFLTRLFTSPLTASNYILGYSISLIPIAVIQSLLFFVVAAFLGLEFTINTLITVVILIPLVFLFVGLGILIGCAVNDRVAPGVSSIIIQLIAFTSGMWFDVGTMAKAFQVICNILPFKHAVDLARNSLAGNYSQIGLSVIVILAYIVGLYILSIFIFKKKMTSDNK